MDNLYYVRTVATANPCAFCRKDTTCCLGTSSFPANPAPTLTATSTTANLAVSDYFYACEKHLGDTSFARRAIPPPPPLSNVVPQSEIDKVTAEYKKKEKEKSEAKLATDPKSSKGWIATGFSAGAAGLSTIGSAAISAFATPESVAVPPESIDLKGKGFILHRDIFAMRVDGARKKAQAKAAMARMEGASLPSVPKGSVGAKDIGAK